ncbi:MAG: VOC family protein, partial [Acidobacteria bacterium]|nr:VOC family protein [Acidobacteriota bacterium]
PGHLAFGVTEDEIDLWRAHLESHDVPVEQEIDWGGSRGRSIYFRDPDGNSLEFATSALWGLSEPRGR